MRKKEIVGRFHPIALKWIVCIISICISLGFIIVFARSGKSGVWLGWLIALLFLTYNLFISIKISNIYLTHDGILIEGMAKNKLYNANDVARIESKYFLGRIEFNDGSAYFFYKDTLYIKHFFDAEIDYEKSIVEKIDKYYHS